MASKGISTRPSAKRLNKKPLILIVSFLVVIIIACFYAVNERQKRLKNPTVAGQAIATPPINNNTPTPEFLQETYITELDQKAALARESALKTQARKKALQEDAEPPDHEVVQDRPGSEKVVVADPAQDSRQRRYQRQSPFYQEASAPVIKPEKTPEELYQEKVIQQKRDARLQALRAPTMVSIGSTAPAAEPSAIPQQGMMPGGNQYAPAQMTLPESERQDQTLKREFLNDAGEDKVVLANAYRPPASPFELKQGHLIPMTLITKINSDLPGRIKAQVTENVYDTATGNYLLIPQGTMVNGIYDSRVVFGQKRVLIAWQRMIFPDGSSLNVGSMPGTDQEGTSGLQDLVDNHYFQIFGAAILMSVVNAGFTLATDTDESTASDKETAQDALAKAAAQQMQQTFSRLIDKIMSIQPELIIRQGKQGHIIITRDILGLKPYNPAQKPTYYLNTVQAN